MTDERHLLRVYLRFKFRDFNKRKVYEKQRKSTYQFTQHFFALKLEVLKHLLDVSQSAPKSRRNRLEKTTLLIQILFPSSSHYRVNKTLCFVSPFINHLSISLFIDLERRKKISSVYILFFFRVERQHHYQRLVADMWPINCFSTLEELAWKFNFLDFF